MILSFDTETSGLDFHHGARPFFLTTCDDQGEQRFWEWPVYPLTRMPEVPAYDLEETHELFDSADLLVAQNAKFDIKALTTLDPRFGDEWPWSKTVDTLIAGHLLASNHPHDLTSMALAWLGVDIQPAEKALEAAVKKARSIVQQAKLREKRGRDEGEDSPLACWRIAEVGLPDMPSAKGSCWNYDYWLPRALVQHLWETSEAGRYWEKHRQQRLNALTEPNIFRRLLANDRVLDECRKLEGWEYHPPEVEEIYSHPWWTVLSIYANKDSEVTLPLWTVQIAEIRRRGLEAIFQERMRAMPVAYRMEERGVTISRTVLTDLREEYREQSCRAGRVCSSIAADLGIELTLPKSGNNDALIDCCFGPKIMQEVTCLEDGEVQTVWTGRRDASKGLGLPSRKRSEKTGEPSLDKEVLAGYEVELEANSPALTFVRNLKGKRKRDTALGFMESYEKFWVQMEYGRDFHDAEPEMFRDWFRLHPSFNMTGTDTLRWSCSNPNAQQISRQESDCQTCKGEGCDRCGGTGEDLHSLRRMFGPAPGREWWSLDAKNIELRIPAYEAGEEEMIALFERPDDPPYFGSNHLLVSHILHPKLFEACRDVNGEIDGRIFKKKYEGGWYRMVKSGNFAVTCGAIEESGTADRAYGVPGAQGRIKGRMTKMAELSRRLLQHAKKFGYVETVPDKTVDPKRGYPVMCSRTDRGQVKPTTPFSYHVQSTACWWMMKAMIRVQDQLDQWRDQDGFDGAIVMQVHDELVLDFPKSMVYPGKENFWNPSQITTGPKLPLREQSNLWRVRKIMRLMEMGGDDIGIPTPTSCEYHEVSWGEGVSL